MTRKQHPEQRRGLRESLEAYAHRLNQSTGNTRAQWRREGLILLHAIEADNTAIVAALTESIVRVCPGLDVPVEDDDGFWLRPIDVIEVEPGDVPGI